MGMERDKNGKRGWGRRERVGWGRRHGWKTRERKNRIISKRKK